MITIVKICGITNLDDAVVAIEAGADLLGFILYPPSKRAIDEKGVQCVVSHLRSLPHCPPLVGVFVNESAETIQQTLNFCDLDAAQLSGDEPIETVTALGERGYKAIRPKTPDEAATLTAHHTSHTIPGTLPNLLIDAYHPTLYGGTGHTGDWGMAQQLAAQLPRLMLAGGLNPSNVAQAIQQVRPWGVDVASGVEASPGKKDHDAVRAFIQNAKSVAL